MDILLIIALLALFFILLAGYSFYKIQRDEGIISFIYHWAFPMGSFVWEDLLVFSLYGAVAALITLLLNDARVGLLFFWAFWIVRGAGEALYFFLQQFIRPKHHPHKIDDHFRLLRTILGPINEQQCFILLQVFHQAIVMIALVGMIVTLLNW